MWGLGVNGQIQKIAKSRRRRRGHLQKRHEWPRRRELRKSTRRRGQKMLKSKKQKFLPVGVKFTPLKPRMGPSRAYRNMPEPVMLTKYTPNDINSRDVGL